MIKTTVSFRKLGKTKKKMEYWLTEIEAQEYVPQNKKQSVLVCILSQNKAGKMVYVSTNVSQFSIDRNTYFLVPEGIFLTKNKQLIATYLEGISLPLSHKNIDKKTISKQYVDTEGKVYDMPVTIIKGLKFDSEILDILLNRNLADKFTKIRVDKSIYVAILLILVGMVIGVISVGVEFV